ncbi:MAG: MBL fold metallo-hydrolase [Acidobacteria bacterium]|nr:MBL fold metallo-hydrolase [Acidobacteriota bacterium]
MIKLLFLPIILASILLRASQLTAQEPDPADSLPPGEGKELVTAACVQCHALRTAVAPQRDAEGWKATVYDMISRGAQIFPEEAEVIIEYLSRARGPESAPSSAAPVQGYRDERTAVESTGQGELLITPLVHGTVLFQYQGRSIYVDPIGKTDYGRLPRPDLVVITDDHPDHLELETLGKISTPDTLVLAPEAVKAHLPKSVVLKNGDQYDFQGIKVQAVPMYNLVRERSPGIKYHPPGKGNGYLFVFGVKRVYVAGDTECIPEMKNLREIDIAFVPINLPYTMPPQEAAECVKQFRPKVVYPYHQGNSDPGEFARQLQSEPQIQVRTLPLP